MLVTGFGLVIGFIEHLQTVTANSFNTVTNLHTLQITSVNAKSYVASLVIAW
jgi:hypothetical protein